MAVSPMKMKGKRKVCEATAPAGASALGLPYNPSPSLQFSGGAVGSWQRALFSALPSWMASPQGSCSPPGLLLLQLLVDRASSGCLAWGLKGWFCSGVSSQFLGSALLEGGRGVSPGSPWSPGLCGPDRTAFL